MKGSAVSAPLKLARPVNALGLPPGAGNQGFVKSSTGNLNVAWQRVQVSLLLVSRAR